MYPNHIPLSLSPPTPHRNTIPPQLSKCLLSYLFTSLYTDACMFIRMYESAHRVHRTKPRFFGRTLCVLTAEPSPMALFIHVLTSGVKLVLPTCLGCGRIHFGLTYQWPRPNSSDTSLPSISTASSSSLSRGTS